MNKNDKHRGNKKMRIQINEETARRAKEMISFSDYREGSATNEYQAECERVKALALKIDEKYRNQIENLIDRYTTKYGNWINAYNRNGASYPSVMISGGANYNNRKHEKQMSRQDKLWEEYKYIKQLRERIENFKPKLDEDDELTKLTKEIDKMKKQLEMMKKINAHYKKYGNLDTYEGLSEKTKKAIIESVANSWYKRPFADFEYTSLRNKIKTKETNLQKLTAPKAESKEKEINGIKIIQNTELDRLQLFFDDIPSAETRNILKSNGFKWSPTNKAWQRQLTQNALYSLARFILPKLEELKTITI